MVNLSTWHLLILSLPTQNATARMRFWRALKAMGCAVLRDGVYLLPHNAEHEHTLQDLAEAVIEAEGMAYLLTMPSRNVTQEAEFRYLFDRSDDYSQLAKSWADSKRTFSALSPQELTRLLRKLRREYEAIKTTDYFPNDASHHAETLWMDFVNTLETALSPGEPQAGIGAIPRLEISHYQQRIWATRRHLWVDRVASAWLIRRFIDASAHFLWLATPADCPEEALGFDFDGAAFTHIGDRVTFEVLLASFGLDTDRGLVRLAKMVHVLDVGGSPVPEASGFEAMLSGARQRAKDDDQLLDEISLVLDALYAHFSNDSDKK